jgi:hypothetical protein
MSETDEAFLKRMSELEFGTFGYVIALYETEHARLLTLAHRGAAHRDVLDALKAIIAACDAAGKDDDLSIVDTFTAEIEDAARAAINKATGQ